MYTVEKPLKIFIVSSSEENTRHAIQSILDNTHEYYEITASNLYGVNWDFGFSLFCLDIKEDPKLVAQNTNDIVLIDDLARPQKQWHESIGEVYNFRLDTLKSYMSTDLPANDLFLVLRSFYSKYYWNLPDEGIVSLYNLAKVLGDEILEKSLVFQFREKLDVLSVLSPLMPDSYEPPLVSIMIPVHNNLALTKDCIESIFKYNDTRFELIVINNNSSDGTYEYLELLKEHFREFNPHCENVVLIHNDENEHFAKANNHGARHASGEYLLLLNNDIVAFPHWLSEMMQYVVSHPDAGAVGAKLLFEDDSIQHAGVTFGAVGWVEHLFKEVHKDFPYLNVQREYPAVTGACLLVKKSIYWEVGGLNEEFINCYEDVDFCLNVTEKGYKNAVVPTAVLYHYESRTPGRNQFKLHSTAVFEKKWFHRMPPSDEYRYGEVGLVVKEVPGETYKTFGYPEPLPSIINKVIENVEMRNWVAAIDDLNKIFIIYRYELPNPVLRLMTYVYRQLGYNRKADFYIGKGRAIDIPIPAYV